MPRPWLVLFLGFMVFLTACERGDRLDYVIEDLNGPVGWVQVRLDEAQADSTRQTVQMQASATLNALGKTFTLRRDARLEIDPRSGILLGAERRLHLGDGFDLWASLAVDADSVRARAFDGTCLQLTPEVDLLLDDGIHFRWLLRRLAATGDTTRYRTIDLDRGAVPTVTAIHVGADTVTLDDATILAQRVDLLYPGAPQPRRLWIDPRDGVVLRSEGGDGTVIRRGRLAAGERFAAVMLDSIILAPVDTFIADERAIRAMTVRAVIELPAVGLTAEDLSVPGQQFVGTVVGRRIDGVFTVAHAAYDPTRSPPFPSPGLTVADDVAMYLEPSPLIESHDTDVVRFAAGITAEAEHRWHAVQLLTRWVSHNIEYDIPGGGTAQGTLKQRRGECGSHSRLLAAFCRAVGIPARVVIGGFYFHDSGGAFGQHAWTEVHMGDAGWIPLDATIGEWEVLDSGHIRLGESAGFAPKSLEILSFELASSTD